MLVVCTLAVSDQAGAQPVLSAHAGGEWCALGKAARGRVTPLGKRASAASSAFDATYYHLTLGIAFAPNGLVGRTHIEGRAVGASLATLALDLSSALHVRRVTTLAGDTLTFTHEADVLTITLAQVVPAGESLGVVVDYAGVPAVPGGGFGSFVFSEPGQGPFVWTLSEPYGARDWWPSKDHPSDKADSVRVTVTVPQGLRVGSNGLLLAETPGPHQTVTYDWHSRYPIASYLVAVTVGRYDVFEQTYVRPDSLAAAYGPLALPLLHYAYPNSRAFQGGDVFSGWHRVVEVLPVLEHWFGPYPFPAEKYGHVHFPYGGGMEHQTMSSMGRSGVGLITHELAHMWYGDLITMQAWPHLWLNEGFATMAELLYWQARPDLYPGTYEAIFDLYYNRALGAQGTLVVQDTTDIHALFAHERVYSKGSMVLHMLRQMVGDDAFRAVLQAYSADATLRYSNATTADFQRVAEAVTGQHLETFFRQWVTEGTGQPTYQVQWSARPEGQGHAVTVVLTQTQAAPASNVEVFEMPVTFAVATADGERRFTIWNDQREQAYTFTVDALPTGLAFDPDRDLLRHPEVLVVAREPEGAVLPHESHLSAVYPNPATHTLQVVLALPEAGPVRLVLYDVLGRAVRVMDDGYRVAGYHPIIASVTDLAPGLYALRLTTATAEQSRAVIIQ